MKKSDIYEIAIKILGLYLFLYILDFLKESLAYFSIFAQYQIAETQLNTVNFTPIFVVAALNLLLLIALDWLLLFRTEKITKILCKKEDYVEDLKILTNKRSIIEIALILIGLFTIISAVPEFAIKLKNYVIILQNSFTAPINDITFIYIAGLKIILGAFVVYYAHSIAKYLTKIKVGHDGLEND